MCDFGGQAMLDNSKLPEQLALPFASEDASLPSAQVFYLRDHRVRPDASALRDEPMPKDQERKLLDRVLERAERLSWYK